MRRKKGHSHSNLGSAKSPDDLVQAGIEPGKARQSKARQGKARQGMARQGMAAGGAMYSVHGMLRPCVCGGSPDQLYQSLNVA